MPRKANAGKKSIARKRLHNFPINLLFDGPSTSRQNRFAGLERLSEMEVTHESNIVDCEEPFKPPPIVVDSSIPLREVQHILGGDCFFKKTSIGTKVFPKTKEKFEFCKKALLDSKIEFHSFNSKENRLFTTFLYGLPKIDPLIISEELKSFNLAPIAVKEIPTRYSSLDDAVYKIQFLRKDFNPKSLSNVKSICDVLVSWKKYKPKKSDKPTQCWNCLMYGHGGDHCNRNSACMACANQHNVNDCPFLKNNKKPATFTCFNCKKHGNEKSDHAANDINCPFRSIYLETRTRVTNRQQKRVRNSAQSGRNFNQSEYPALNQNNNSNNSNNNNTVSSVQQQLTYSQQLQRNNNSNSQNNNSNTNQQRTSTDSLFSINDLFGIFMSAVGDLQKCSTKLQQVQVVVNLIKHAYDFK